MAWDHVCLRDEKADCMNIQRYYIGSTRGNEGLTVREEDRPS